MPALIQIALMWLATAATAAAAVPAGGSSVVGKDCLTTAVFRSPSEIATGSFGPLLPRDAAGEGPAAGWSLEIAKAGPRLWSAQLSIPIQEPIAVGDAVLISFMARCPRPPPKGAAGGVIVVENTTPGSPKLGMGGFTATDRWQQIDVPFLAGVDSIPGKTVLAFQLGERPQLIQIADLRVVNYARTLKLADLPHAYLRYEGREDDAAWRREALDRIEKTRVRGFAARLVDAAGEPIREAKVRARLARHEFLFGGTIKGEFFAPGDSRFQNYRDAVDRHFSGVVFENDLKPGTFEESLANTDPHVRWDWTQAAADWCRERGIAIRGHYMVPGVWGSFASRDKQQDAALRERLLGHMRLLAGEAGRFVDDWDVINHPVGWTNPPQTVRDVLGRNFYGDVIREARRRTDRPLWINEDRTFNAGFQQDHYFECVQELVAGGTPPDGIGIQGHFHSGSLVAPTEILRVSDRFAALIPALMLTEWDVMTNGDEQLQADYLRDTLLAAYSHPAYKGFLMWVWWEGAGWRPEAALFRRDGTEKPNGRVWREWVSEKWRTDVELQTDAEGIVRFRGHAGLYDLTVEHEGRTTTIKQPFLLRSPQEPVTVAWPAADKRR
ncbi:MAG: endo-1,4-beta-xylanase [Pirellulales bacterium]